MATYRAVSQSEVLIQLEGDAVLIELVTGSWVIECGDEIVVAGKADRHSGNFIAYAYHNVQKARGGGSAFPGCLGCFYRNRHRRDIPDALAAQRALRCYITRKFHFWAPLLFGGITTGDAGRRRVFRDQYDAQVCLRGHRNSPQAMLATKECAYPQYSLKSFMDTQQVTKIADMVTTKYGKPSSQSGNAGLGPVTLTHVFRISEAVCPSKRHAASLESSIEALFRRVSAG